MLYRATIVNEVYDNAKRLLQELSKAWSPDLGSRLSLVGDLSLMRTASQMRCFNVSWKIQAVLLPRRFHCSGPASIEMLGNTVKNNHGCISCWLRLNSHLLQRY